MYQALLDQILQSTETAGEHSKEIFSLIDKIINELEAEANLMVELSALQNFSSLTLTDTYRVSIENLMKLKDRLQEEMTLCYGVASRINNPQTLEYRYLQCKDAAYATYDQMAVVEQTLHCLKILSDNRPKSEMDSPSYSMLYSEMDAFGCKIQELNFLYEKLAECCLEARTFFDCCDACIRSHDAFEDIPEDEDNDAIVAPTTSPDAGICSHDAFPEVTLSLTEEDKHNDAILIPNEKLAGDSKTQIDIPKVELPKVNFSAIAPKELVKGEYALIEIIMYENAFRNEVEQMIADLEMPIKETKGSVLSAEKNAHIKIVLNSPDLVIDDNVEELLWSGEYARFTFPIELPIDYRKTQILFTASVYINDVIATRLKFVAKCKTFREQKIEIKRDDILSAFVSYASQDRHRVAMIIQGMKKARPDMDIFFDVESLRSGDDWEKALWTEIDKRDVLFLCWSHYAKESKWVDAEWRYAFSNKGVDCIEPIPIEAPDVCPPPAELTRKHFNDKLLYIINSVKEPRT